MIYNVVSFEICKQPDLQMTAKYGSSEEANQISE